jgi:hypothetical protein
MPTRQCRIPAIEGRGPSNRRQTTRRIGDANTTPVGQMGDAIASNNNLRTRNTCGLSSDILISLVPARMAHGHHSQPKHRETQGLAWRQVCILPAVSLSTDNPNAAEATQGQRLPTRAKPGLQRSFPDVKRGQPTLWGPLHEHTLHSDPPYRRIGSCVCRGSRTQGWPPQHRPMGPHLPHEPLSIIPSTLHACWQ